MNARRLDVWPPLPLDVYARRPSSRLPFPLGEQSCALFKRARHALWQGLRALGLEPGDEVLMPAYHHGSEVEALVRLGLVCRFYEGGETLVPNESELETLLGPRTRALYLIHYLGFAQDAARWRRWCDERGLYLLEDAAQAWLASLAGQPLGSFGDLAIFCLYKSFGVPDGGAVLCAALATSTSGSNGVGLPGLARRHLAWLMQCSPWLTEVGSRLERHEPYSPEVDFALANPGSRPSAATVFLLPRVADLGAAACRRFNYQLLLDKLGDLVPPPFADLPPGAAPFGFPVTADDKEELLARLVRERVHALDFWRVPHSALPAPAFPGAASRRERVVVLPVHQELREPDLERIVRAVRPGARRTAAVRLEPFSLLDAPREEWSELAWQSSNIFASWDWLSTWWSHFGDGRPLLTTACRAADGRLLAILPLYLWSSRPLRVLRFLGHGPSDQLGPIYAPRDRTTAARALRHALAQMHRQWDIFVGEQLPGDEHWGSLLGGRTLSREGSPVLRAHGLSWDGYLVSRSANLRQQVGRRERNLARKHELCYRLADDPLRLEDDLETFFALHRARWQACESSFARLEAFHRDFAARAFQRGWLRLWFLELDGYPCASWYGFRFAGVESYYQAGRAPGWEKASIGFVLLAHSIRAALEDGVREYRFLRGDEPFKHRFADLDPGLETIGLARGVTAVAALAGAHALGRRGPFAALRRRLTE